MLTCARCICRLTFSYTKAFLDTVLVVACNSFFVLCQFICLGKILPSHERQQCAFNLDTQLEWAERCIGLMCARTYERMCLSNCGVDASIYWESGYGERYNTHDVAACTSQKTSNVTSSCVWPKCTVRRPPGASYLNTDARSWVCSSSRFGSNCFLKGE